MFTANILAKEAEVSVYTVRHYTRIGLLQPRKDSANGYKIYKSADVVRLKFISTAKNLGFTLSEITDILNKAEHGESPCPSVRKIIVRHIEENRRKIKALQKLQKKMENALADWENLADSLPDGNSVCRLIESVSEN